MAIYHFSGSVISRSQGRSAVACAAYRSAEKLIDERYDKVHDYTHKQDVAYTEILLPDGAPKKLADRETLWNEVERCEKRKDAQLAREIQVSLPRELTLEQNKNLVREFVQKEYVDKGMIADLAIHIDKASDGELQPHAHILLTLRKVDESGFGQKERGWNAKENILAAREAWAETANRHLAINGHDIQIDHRSYAEQGISLEPQYKIGAVVAQHQMARLEDHKRIARENGEKIFAKPEIALDALTRQQSTFTHHDLARFVNRQTVDSDQFSKVYEKVKASEELVFLGKDHQGRDRFTTKEMLGIEKSMVEHSKTLLDREAHGVSARVIENTANPSLSPSQKQAYDHLVSAGDIKCVVGYAGTGKSYLLNTTRETWEKEGYKVIGATLAGIAAEGLESGSGIESRTLASRMYYWDRGDELLDKKTVLVVDEAGMLGSRQLMRVLDEAQKHHAKVVLIGDPQQLQAIEAGGAFRAIAERTNYVELTEILRQKEQWQKDATREFATQETSKGLSRYGEHDCIHEFETTANAKKAMVDMWNDVRITDPEKSQIMLSYTRKDVKELNEMARDLRRELGELGEDKKIMTERGEKIFAESDRIYFLKNDRYLDVKNGSLGTIEKIHGKEITVRLDRGSSAASIDASEKSIRVKFNVDQYNQIDHGYAATIHKTQSITVDRSYVLASKYMDAQSTYTGMTRHREGADLFWSREEFSNTRELEQSLSRDRTKDVTLDYGALKEDFAKNRGIEVSQDLGRAVQKEIQRDLTPKVEHSTDQFMRELGITPQDRLKFEGMPYVQHDEKDDLKRFKEAFERENPDLSKALSKEIKTDLEKRVESIEKRYEELNQRLQKDPRDRTASREMKELVSGISKDKAVMQNIKEHSPELNQKIQSLSKQHERDLSRGRSL
jgi:Ti-type conjugative transfer relaxase TraA